MLPAGAFTAKSEPFAVGTDPLLPGASATGGPPKPFARAETWVSCSSSWPYRWERRASVVTVPITAHTVAISTTDATTSRARSVRG